MRHDIKINGFGLIELMVATAIMTVLMFGIVQLILTNTNATKSIELTNHLDLMMSEIQMLLKNNSLCQSNVANFSPNHFDPSTPNSSIPVLKISSLTGDIILNNGSLPNAPGTIVTIDLENFNQISTNNYSADLAVTLNKGTGAIGGQIIKRRIPLDLITAGSSPAVTITGCMGNTIPYGSCPPGSLMFGFSSAGVECRAVTAPISSTTTAAYSPSNPGPGCGGDFCKAYDYGPCIGNFCVTNGNSCSGKFCCAGPTCPGL